MKTSKKIDWKPIIRCYLATGLIGGISTFVAIIFAFFLWFGLDTTRIYIAIAGGLFIALLSSLVSGWASLNDQLD